MLLNRALEGDKPPCKSFRKELFFASFLLPYKTPNTFLAPLALGSAQPGSKARCGWGSFAATCLQPCGSVGGTHSCSGTSGPIALWSPTPLPAPTLVCATSVTPLLLFMARPNEQGLISQGITPFPILTVCFRRLSLTWCSQAHILSAYFLELYFGLFPLCSSSKAVETEYSSSSGWVHMFVWELIQWYVGVNPPKSHVRSTYQFLTSNLKWHRTSLWYVQLGILQNGKVI